MSFFWTASSSAFSLGRCFRSSVAAPPVTPDFFVAPTAAGTGDGLTSANAMSWTTFAATSGATLDGKTAAILPGNYPTKTISFSGNTNPITLVASDPANPPVFDQLTLDGVSNVKLQQLSLVSSAWNVSAANTNPAILIKHACSTIVLDRNLIRGNYRGNTAAAIDTVAELPEYAVVTATMVGGVVTALDYSKHPFVGDLMAPGTYPLIMNETGGTGFSGSFTVTLTTVNGVTGNFITGTTLTSGGTGYSMTLHESARMTWTGQHRMVDYLPQGMAFYDGIASISSFTATDNTITDLSEAFKSASPTGSIVITGNQVARIYGCLVSFGLSSNNVPPTTTKINDNVGVQTGFYDSYDAGNPHGDLIHLYMNDFAAPFTPSDWKNVQIERNALIGAGARGSDIGILMGDCPTGIVFDAPRIVGNIMAADVATSAMNFDGLRDAYIYRNTMVRYDTANAKNSTALSVNVPSPTLSINAIGKSFVSKNIGEVVSLNNFLTVKGSGNVQLGQNGSSIAYSAAFAAPTGTRNTLATALTAYAPSATYAGSGAGGSDGYLNYTTRTTNRSMEPTFVSFDGKSNQATSTAVNSDWCRVIGGPTSAQAWSITNGTAQVANDSIGTGATTAATSGTVTSGQWMRVNQTTSASSSTATTSTLTINGNSYPFLTVTQSAASFATVDNQATAYSRMTALPAETGIRKAIVAVMMKNDSIATGNVALSDNLGNFRLSMPTTSQYRLALVPTSAGGLSYRTNLAPTLGWETHLIEVDWTQTAQTNMASWYCNDVYIPQGAGGNYDTTGTGSFSTSQMVSSLFSLFAKTDGTSPMDGQMAYFWMHWGDASFVLPDLSDAAVRAKFTADNINLADGSGPLGFAPKLFFTGNAAAWNAGLANKGSLALSMTKVAGTYV